MTIILWKLYRVRTDLEKSLNLTLVLENSWNFKIVPFVLEFCKIALENVNFVLENNKIHRFSILLDLCDARKKTVKIAGFSLPVVLVFINTIMKIFQ